MLQYNMSYDISLLQEEFRDAVELKCINTAKKLLSLGANPNLVYNDGQGVIHVLAERGDVGFFRDLYTATKETLMVNLRSEPHGETPLIIAAINCAVDFVKDLLIKNADPNICDTRGRGPLHYAASLSNDTMVKDLIDFSASTTLEDVFLNTPLSHAVIEKPSMNIVLMLLKLENDMTGLGSLFLDSVLNCNSLTRQKITMLLIYCGVDVNYMQPVTHQNCLHIVAITNYVPLAKQLLNAGANLYVLDITKRLPVHIAEDHQNKEVVDLFQREDQAQRLLLRRSTWLLTPASLSFTDGMRPSTSYGPSRRSSFDYSVADRLTNVKFKKAQMFPEEEEVD